MLDYAEYTSFLETLQKSDLENTYKDLISKEDKVLDTVNHVVNTLNERKIRDKSFTGMSLSEIYHLLFLELPQMVKDFENMKSLDDLPLILMKNNRPIYMGIIMVIMGIFLFLLYNSK